MKGMIFTEFFDMVEEVHGLQMAESLIDQTAPASGGIYTAVGDYDYREIVSYAVALSERTGVPLPELLRAFGSWVFERLFVAHYSGFFAEPRSVFEFLSSIESHIHVEVRKLYPDAQLPRFETDIATPDQMRLTYRSQRPLAEFAMGLIQGCIAHYQEPIVVTMQDLSAGAGTSARFELTRTG
jgi:hypothetical protein